MLRIGICDDEPLYLEKVNTAVASYFSPAHVKISTFSDGRSFLETVKRGRHFDIAVLDIVMPQFSGLEIAKALKRDNPGIQIIFLTCSRDYAVDAFSLGAVHYVLKPFDERSFHEALERASAAFRLNDDMITLNLPGGMMHKLPAFEIIYIESLGHRRIVHTTGGKYEETRITLSSFLLLLERLCPSQFIQPYRGYIINLGFVKSISPGKITLTNGDGILIKRGDFRRLRNIIFDYMFPRTEDGNGKS